MLCGRKEGGEERHEGQKQNVFSQPRFGENNRDFHVARTPRLDRVTSPKKLFSPEISLSFLCVHTFHMTSYLFVRICLQVTYTNKNRTSYDLPYVQVHETCAHS